MKIEVKVIPRAKNDRVKEEEGILKAYLTASPVRGKANESLVKLLSSYYGVKKRQVRIVRGFRSRDKVVEIIK